MHKGLFGTYRLMLALMVLLKHFKAFEVFAGLAVWAFFMLSGFLITGVLNSRYGFSRSGIAEFATGRALRLFPTYWLSVVMAIVLMMGLSHIIKPIDVNDAFAIPATFTEWATAVSMFGNSVLGLGRIPYSPSPSAWAVEIEIFLYVISALWLSKSLSNAKRTMIACAGLFLVFYVASKFVMRAGFPEISREMTYSFLPVALLPYAIGAFLWFHRDAFKAIQPTVAQLSIAALALFVVGYFGAQKSVTGAFVVSLPLFAYFTLSLSRAQSAEFKKVDEFFGHMSYPVYLLHWICGYMLIAGAVNYGWPILYQEGKLINFTLEGFCWLVALTLVIGAMVAAFFELPIENRRRQWAATICAHFSAIRASGRVAE